VVVVWECELGNLPGLQARLITELGYPHSN